ncbi:MAG: DNA repair protein RadC [Elusimicrobia bacterium]|nr:DNA repair protein RadC [Elusimicrobiota bacterium]
MKSLEKPGYIGHRRRIKEKYKSGGLMGWLDYEVLELALTYAIPQRDTKPLAKELLCRFKTINNVLDANRQELVKIKGISEHTALFLNFLKDATKLYLKQGLVNKDLVSSPQAVYDYFKASLKGHPDEEFKALFLNSQNQILAVETMQTGTVNKAVVYPRKIVERALYHHAATVVVAHNHPGGSLAPSAEDRQVTGMIREALKIVEIDLLDHIIIGGDGYFSFKETGTI